MTDVAIRVENLGKKYKLGSQKNGSFRESITRLFQRNTSPVSGSLSPDSSQEFWALKDVSFEIKQGEAVGIIGRNGAGKSTLLKILSRITEPTKGRFEIFGRVSSLLEVGTGFHPELTGRENVYLNGTILGMRRSEVKAKFDEIVAFSGVEKFIDTPVKHYSSGMQVRLAFAVAAHLEPEILIIDEVLAVGDAEFQKKCLGKMEDVTGQGRTVLFVSHNMGAVQQLCTKGTLLSNGKVIFSGSQQDTIKKYLQANQEEINIYKANLKNREGSGEIIVKNIKIDALENENVSTLLIGQPFQVKIYYDIIDPKFDLTGLRFGIYINDVFGNSLFFHSTRLVEFDYTSEDIKKSRLCICNIKELPLNQGTFYITINIYKDHHHIDLLQNVMSFTLISGKVFNYTENPAPNHSLVLGYAEWALKLEDDVKSLNNFVV